MKSLTKAVSASFIICIIYTITAIVLECKGVQLSDTLTQYFFMTFGIEFASAAAIQISKSVIKRANLTDKIEKIKQEGLTVEKSDLNEQEEENDIYYG